MIKPNKLENKVVDILLPLMAAEYDAHYFYRALSNWARGEGFFVAAEFFSKESDDELKHAKMIEDYLTDWNVVPKLPSIQSPRHQFPGLSEGILEAYRMEYDLYEMYEDNSMKVFSMDLCTFDFLQKLRSIQTAAVAEYSDKLNILEGVDVSDKFKMLLIEEKLFPVNG